MGIARDPSNLIDEIEGRSLADEMLLTDCTDLMMAAWQQFINEQRLIDRTL